MSEEISRAEIEEALRKIRTIPEYDWLFGEVEIFMVADLVTRLRVSADQLLALLQLNEFPGAGYLTRYSGWRIPRSAIAVYLARRVKL